MRLLLLFTAMLMLASCATNPVTHKPEFVMLTEKNELDIGRQLAQMVADQFPLLPANDSLVQYVDKVGQQLAAISERPELTYHFNVINDGTINAFALPGGYIYIHRGLLVQLNSEAELAAVLGHEISHVTARHAVQRQTRIKAYNIGETIASIIAGVPYGVGDLSDMLATAMITGYGSDQELQSDELSVQYLVNAGYKAAATTELLKTLQRLDNIRKLEHAGTTGKALTENYHGVFASHPESRKRIEEAIARASRLQQSGIYKVGRDNMLDALDGYPVTGSPDDGIVAGRKFLHAKFGFQIAFPDRWLIRNSSESLIARLQGQEVYCALAVKSVPDSASAESVLASLFPAVTQRDADSGKRNGYAYAEATLFGSAPNVEKAAIRATVYRDGGRAFILLLYADRDEADRYQGQFRQIRHSFRRYDGKDVGELPKITIRLWRDGDSWQKLAAASGDILGRFTARRLAALNGLDPDQSPPVESPYKFVR